MSLRRQIEFLVLSGCKELRLEGWTGRKVWVMLPSAMGKTWQLPEAK
jgi:hypothetical protein